MARRDVPNLPRWECPWLYAEMGFVSGMPFRLLWWAWQTQMQTEELVRTMIFANRATRITGSEMQNHLLLGRPIGREHVANMTELMDKRIERAVECPGPTALLQAAVTLPMPPETADHLKVCDTCDSQVQFLGKQADPFLREYARLRGPAYE